MLQFAQIDITAILGFGAVVIAVWNMTTRIDAHITATRSELQAMGSRIDAMGQRIDDVHKEIMTILSKMK